MTPSFPRPASPKLLPQHFNPHPVPVPVTDPGQNHTLQKKGPLYHQDAWASSRGF
ncbi:hypothetical protein CCHR01_10784 [Colletotrichum chrysophilum]|uniref:Uncharacterized protein n=1 Tax=Colletotrichum chrysophilum TaxID=1836956 RepID=A0AAD9AEC9_9PEZI|nr:hypothetical protein CCHR01_10784 [Colletotrichum chrysophilum]